MADEKYDTTTARRPRLKEPTNDTLEKLKEKIEFMLEEAEDISDDDKEELNSLYKGSRGKVSFDRIIREGLDALQERGLIE